MSWWPRGWRAFLPGGDVYEVWALALDVCEHLAAVSKSGAACEELCATLEGAPLDDADFYVAAAPLVHEFFAGLIHVYGAGACEG